MRWNRSNSPRHEWSHAAPIARPALLMLVSAFTLTACGSVDGYERAGTAGESADQGYFASGPETASLPAQTRFAVTLAEEVVSSTAAPGQPVAARIADDVVVDGNVLIPAGSEVRAEVSEVKPAKRFGGQAMVSVAFVSVSLPDGSSVPVEGSLSAYASKETAKDAGTIAGGAVGGAVLGKLIGKEDKDAAIGALVGGGIATAIASRKGDEAYLPAGTAVTVRSTRQAQVPVV